MIRLINEGKKDNNGGMKEERKEGETEGKT